MTKLTADSFASFVKDGAKSYKAILLFGQDEGLIEECREKASRAIVSDLRDPFRTVWLTPAKIKEEPAILSAEANAISLMGGRRVITIRGADNLFTKILQDFLPSYQGDALIIVTAGSLKTKDSLPSLFEKTPTAGVLACYSDEGAALKKLVYQTLEEAGLTASNDVISYISENLGADRLLSRSELSKLIAYMGNEKTVTMDDAQACIGDASALSIDQMLYALSGGNQVELHETLDRLLAEGQAPIGLLRAASGHFKKFHEALGKVEDGATMTEAVNSLFLHFKRVDQFKMQMGLWNVAKVGKVMDLLVQAETDSKRSGRPQELICARLFMQIASQARRTR